MRLFLGLALGVAIIAATTLGQSAYAQGNAIFLATYVDVMPSSVDTAERLLDRYREASRRDEGNLRFLVLQEISRPNRFAIVEAWKDKAALDAHVAADHTHTFRERLKSIQNAPYDERINNLLYSGQDATENRPNAVYVVTHVDVVPPAKDDCMALLKNMSADTAKDPGNIGYLVLQQANRANHFTVFEKWRGMKAAEAHAMADHTRAFREKLVPIAGALYDERFYKALTE
jgi:autoinducer 2-degrading protein